jgi:AcrR family transcriptional regulator
LGRPRDGAIDVAILRAARDLLAEHGYGGVTIDRIARRAGVGRPTVYRRWSTKADLMFDAIFEEVETIEIPQRGDAVTGLLEMAKVFSRALASPAAAQALVAVMADVGSDSDIAANVRGRIRGRTTDVAALVERAQREGLVRSDLDPVTFVHAVAGALYYRAAVLGEHVTEDLVVGIFDLFARGLQPPEPPDTTIST